MKYYVLGKKDNEMLLSYRKRYLQQLIFKVNSINNIEIKNKILQLLNDEEFILNCDNSSRIEYLYLVGNGEEKLYSHKSIEENFISDIDYYLEHKLFYNNLSHKIKGTDIFLSTFDRNPYNGLEEHPDRVNNSTQIGFGNKNKEYWEEIYTEVFTQLKTIDNGLYDELNFIIQKIIPLGTSEETHNSASYKEVIGHLYMGLTTNKSYTKDMVVIQCLEGIIHESSHNKLNLINKFDEVLLNDYTLGFYSPYRPDARHVRGVFLGIHAFVPTIYTLLKFYKKNKLTDPYLLEKILEYNIKNNLSYKILKKYGIFTHIGDEIMSEILYVMKLTNNEIKDLNNSSEILQRSKEKVSNHFKEVKKLCPTLRY